MIYSAIKKGMAHMLAIALLSSTFVACSEDDNDSSNNISEDTVYAMTLALQGTDGSFTYHTVAVESLMSGSISAVGQGIEQPGYYTYNEFYNKVFGSGGMGITSLVAIEKTNSGTLQETASLTNFQNSLNDLTEAEDKNLVGVEMSSSSDVIRLHHINAETVSVTKSVETPVTELTTLESPAYSGMVVSGNYLYISYYISNPDTYATEYTDKAEVAVFSYPELEFVKVIEDIRTGPIGGFGTSSGLIKDENGNVYALSHSNPANGYSQTTKKGGILRINNGETTFDNEYFLDIEALTNGLNTAHLVYLENGKVFSEINMDLRNEQGIWSDSPLQPAIIDLYKQEVHFIEGVPAHGGIGRKLAATALKDGNRVYLPVPEETSIFIYEIDTDNYTAIKGAEVEANFVAGFYKF